MIIGLSVGVLVITSAAVWRHLRLSDLANIGAGYTARQTCGCLFISRRSPESCRGDLDSLAQTVVSVEIGQQRVTARSMGGIARATARYEPGQGCSLEE